MITNEQVEAALKAWYDAGDAGNFASMFAALKAADLASAARIAELEAALKQSSRIEASLASRIANLMDALEPFDEMLQRDFSIMADDKRYADDFMSTVLMRLGDLRAARAAYLGEKDD